MRNLDAWSYYREVKGRQEALKHYFPELLSDDIIRSGLTQLRVAEFAIDARVAEIAAKQREVEGSTGG